MAKTSGLGDNLYVGGYDLSNDVGSLGTIGGGVAPLEVTGIDKSAFERIGGLRDGRIEYNAFLNTAADKAHDRLGNLPTTDTILPYCRGTTLGNPAAMLVGKQLSYDGTRAADGGIAFDVSEPGNGFGLEWGRQLTPGQQLLGAAGAGTGVDFTAATAFGAQAYVHVMLFTGTSCTFTLQDFTADTPASYANITGGASVAMTAIGSQRWATANTQTIRRWVRVNVTGTFSALLFAVSVVKNDVAGQLF